MSTVPYYPNQGFPRPATLSAPLPVGVAVAGPARQRRLTVLLRVFMVIPHYVVLEFLGIAAVVVAFIGWWGALFTGRLPDFAATFLTGYVRWATRVAAYALLLADAYPPFSLQDDPAYPVRVALPQGDRLNRAAVFFRWFLALPANLLAALVLVGGGTIVGFVGWLVTLATGQLPAPLHLAYAAVVRFAARTYSYLYLLTPAYPGGLFGDAPQAAAYGSPDYTAPDPGYGTPGYAAPDPGYDTPGYGAPGYGTPGYTAPDPGYGTPGYSTQDYGAPGYGTHGSVYCTPAGFTGYGAPGPAAAAPDWRLLLTGGAKRLVALFIVLGALTYAAYLAVIGLAVSSGTSALQAGFTVDSAYNTLTGNLNEWEGTIKTCGTNFTCVTAADGKAATYFSSFAGTLQGTPMPSSAQAAASRLDSDATQAAQDFTELSQTTSVTQYQATFDSTGLQQILDSFDQDYSALNSALGNS